MADLHIDFLRQQSRVHAEFLKHVLGPIDAATAVDSTAASTQQSAPVQAPCRCTATRTRIPRHHAFDEREGPRFDRAQLEILASGRISSVFGPLFEGQDAYARQVRMPEPPLLFADRVTGIDAEPGSMGVGTIWTETDITESAWYLHEGRMPAGIFVEAGQADLLLVSWLGIDAHNRGERVYRLLGCELETYGELPTVGDALAYEIRIDSHVQNGDQRIFSFSSECWMGSQLRMRVRNGKLGFSPMRSSTNRRASAGTPTRPSRSPRSGARRRSGRTMPVASFPRTERPAFADGTRVRVLRSWVRARRGTRGRLPIQSGRMRPRRRGHPLRSDRRPVGRAA